MEIINAFGLQCPRPLMLAKQRIDAGEGAFGIQVDNETAVKNVSRLAERTGRPVAVSEVEGGWLLSFGAGAEGSSIDAAPSRDAAPSEAPSEAPAPACAPGVGCGYAVFVGKDHVGEGEGELGHNLMKMALYTLSECGDAPASLLFMNSGVKLVAGGEDQVVESVRKLVDQGTDVLVCGTCLDFYGLKERLQAGEVSNMYDILERMREAAKVITL